MQSATKTIKEFLHRDKQHDTEVREIYNPAVKQETIRPTETEEQTTAIDRELHQDHFQTRVQPVEDHVQEETKHSHKVLPVQHREQHHGKDDEIRKNLADEKAKFKNTRKELPVERTSMSAGTIAGEHVHHHVHEQVQPVIEREVVQPSVIHTTVPIHERIEHAPTFHPATVQPRMSMEEYMKAGGTMDGKPEVRDVFEGEPQVRENGGAHQTHPNAYSNSASGHHTDHPSAETYRKQRMGPTPPAAAAH